MSSLWYGFSHIGCTVGQSGFLPCSTEPPGHQPRRTELDTPICLCIEFVCVCYFGEEKVQARSHTHTHTRAHTNAHTYTQVRLYQDPENNWINHQDVQEMRVLQLQREYLRTLAVEILCTPPSPLER